MAADAPESDEDLWADWTVRDGAEESDLDSLIEANLLSHEEILNRLGSWPGRAIMGDPFSGKPFVSEVGDYRSLHFDWTCVQSGMRVTDPLKLTLDYTKTMMGFLFFNSNPQRIEMIGLGGGSLAKYCNYILPDADITIVELNPEVISLREHFFVPPDSDRFRILCEDGADYVKSSKACPEILLIDGFDATGQPPQLCSSEFYDRCYNRLAPEGLMIVNLWGDDSGYRHYAERAERSFFGNSLTIPSQTSANQTVIARKGSNLTLSKTELHHVAAVFKRGRANFLPAIGKRILRQIERRRKPARAPWRRAV